MMPQPKLIRLMALCLIPFGVAAIFPEFAVVGLIVTMGVALFALLDLATSPMLNQVDVAREAKDVLSVGARNGVTVWLKNRNPQPITLTVHDDVPQPSTWHDLPFTIQIPAERSHSQIYQLQPHHRGQNQFGTLFLRSDSRFGLWTFHDERPLPFAVKIYPDIQAVRGVELLARQNRLAEAGVRTSRLKGRGSDFDRLREYRREDEFRSIDWKATARYQSLISREYVVEKNQNLLLLLDCGRSMCNTLDGVTHFDRAMNAAILLAYVALRQGDTVGVMVCDSKLRRWVRPVRGIGGIERLISQIYDLTPSYEATDYTLMAEELRQRYRKRSLVVLLTHSLDEVHQRMIISAMRRMKSPHLVLGSFLQNVPLWNRSLQIPETDEEAFQVAAALEMVAAQQTEVKKLQRTGLMVIDAVPEQLSPQLISRYLDIKARHLL